MYWLDYSAAKLSGAVIKAAGYGGVIRYIDAPNLLSTKHTSLAEYRDHVASGLTVRLVHQGTTTDADSGFQGGVNRATRAKAGADYLGYTGVIYFTNDRTTVPKPAAWTAYLDGAASVLGIGRVGAYGFYNALNLAKGHASAFWQAGRRSDLVPHANFWQDNNTQVNVGGITCDRNLVIADYSPTTTQEKKLNPDQDQWLREIHLALFGTAASVFPANNNGGLVARVNELVASNAGLVAAVAKLSTSPDLTPDAVRQIVTDAVKQNIAITGEIHIGPAGA